MFKKKKMCIAIILKKLYIIRTTGLNYLSLMINGGGIRGEII